tara:strand:+ start:2524 stop:2658 length:135 start_codon:yes stop_codon:yes gene_type:complete
MDFVAKLPLSFLRQIFESIVLVFKQPFVFFQKHFVPIPMDVKKS